MHIDQARSYDAHGRQMFADGQFLQAAAAFTMAAELFRELAETGSEQAALQYASQLNNAGLCMAKMGRHAEAVDHLGEAFGIVEPFWSDDPSLTPFASGILGSLANSLTELGLHDRAIELTEQVLPLRRAAAEGGTQAMNPELAKALRTYAQARSNAGRELPRALPAATEAVAIYQALADTNPAFHTDLVQAYGVLSGVLGKLGRHDEADEVRSWGSAPS